MKKKEVQEAIKKYYMIFGISMGGGLLVGVILFLIFLNITDMASFFLMFGVMAGIIGVGVATVPYYIKPKRMEANLCIKCSANDKTEVTEDKVVGQETVKGVLYEVHLVTHTCKNCGTSYSCHEYKKL